MDVLPLELQLAVLRFLSDVQDVKSLSLVSRDCRSLVSCVSYLEIPPDRGLRVSVLSLFSSVQLSGPVIIPAEEPPEIFSLLHRAKGDLHVRVLGAQDSATLVNDWIASSLDFVRVRAVADPDSRTHLRVSYHSSIDWNRGVCALHIPRLFDDSRLVYELEKVKESLRAFAVSLPISDLDFVGYKIGRNGFIRPFPGDEVLQRSLLRNPNLRTLRIRPRGTLGNVWVREPTSNVEHLIFPDENVEEACEFALSVSEKRRKGIRRIEGLYIPWIALPETLERLRSMYPGVSEWYLIINYTKGPCRILPLDLESPPSQFLKPGKLFSRLQYARKMSSTNPGYRFYYQ